MTRGFYEQLGVGPAVTPDELRAAYGRAVAHLIRRREATLAQRGDPSALDLTRTHLDEAWDVLSNPIKRRRYDAMLALAGDGFVDLEPSTLWEQVAGALIPPSSEVGASVLRAATSLAIGKPPPAPRPAPRVGDAPSAAVSEVHVVEPPTDFGAPRPTPHAMSIGWDEPPTVSGPPTMVPENLPEPPTGVHTSVDASEQLMDIHGPSGAFLRAMREHRGMAMSDLATTTRINEKYLEALEREDFATLPSAAAFVRGYVHEVARVLGVDTERLVAGYMRRFHAD